jgi:hypothetical protein
MPCHSPSTGKRETQLLKLTSDRPFADPDKAARRLLGGVDTYLIHKTIAARVMTAR